MQEVAIIEQKTISSKIWREEIFALKQCLRKNHEVVIFNSSEDCSNLQQKFAIVLSDFVSFSEMNKLFCLEEKSVFVTAIQLLPSWLWKRTYLRFGQKGTANILTPDNKSINGSLEAKPFFYEDIKNPFCLPVFSLGHGIPSPLKKVLSNIPVCDIPVYIFDKQEALQSKPSSAKEDTEEDILCRYNGFLATATPVARRLAHLVAAADDLSIPIDVDLVEALARDFKRVITGESYASVSKANIVEFFLSGLFDEREGEYSFKFKEGVAERFLSNLPVKNWEVTQRYVLNRVNK